MKAIILAAGQSKRLEPLTYNKPKCLLKVGDKTIIDYQIESLKQNSVRDVVVVVGFAKDILMNHLRNTHPDINFIFIENPDFGRTYPAYGLWLAREHLEGGALYLNGDVIFDPQIITKAITDSNESVTAIQNVPWDEEEVNVILNKSGQVLEIGKHISRELSQGEFIGVTKFGARFSRLLSEALDYFVSNDELKKFAADAINLAIQRGGKLYALDLSDLPATEIDTLEDYEKVKAFWTTAKPAQKS